MCMYLNIWWLLIQCLSAKVTVTATLVHFAPHTFISMLHQVALKPKNVSFLDGDGMDQTIDISFLDVNRPGKWRFVLLFWQKMDTELLIP